MAPPPPALASEEREELGVGFQSEMDVCVLFECSLYFDLHRQRVGAV